MPRPCSICIHARRGEIESALVVEESYRNIAERFGTSSTALVRHKQDHLPAALVQAEEVRDAARSVDVMAELQRIMARVNLLFDACDRWLRDPDDPTRYDVGARAEDITVIYTEPAPPGPPVRRKAKLSALLEQVQEGRHGLTIGVVEKKQADVRELILKTSNRLESQLELIAKLLGELDDRPQVNVLVAPEWLTVRSSLLAALMAYPEARAAVSGALLQIESNGAVNARR